MGRMRRIAIIGAGPIGLEAAAAAHAAGHAVTVLERGEVADHVRQWGHVRLFTDFGMNAGPAGRALAAAAGVALPGEDERLTGAAWRDRYLLPLATLLRGEEVRLESGAAVRHVSRRRLLKNDAVGEGERRAADGFRILYDRRNVEHVTEADVVLDCSGTWGNPNWLGPGGAPALGERALRGAIAYHPPDVLGVDFDRYAGRHTCLVGNGDSAATTAVALATLAETVAGTTVTWVTRTGGDTPVAARVDDPLAGRHAIVAAANATVTQRGGARWIATAHVLEVTKDATGFALRLTVPDGETVVRADEVVATIGYEPDDALYRELQVHECYASRAPMKLAAALLAASGSGSGDCLDLGGFGPDVLRNPEPGFFILGAKSYGKTSAFLLRTGYEQVRDALEMVGAG